MLGSQQQKANSGRVVAASQIEIVMVGVQQQIDIGQQHTAYSIQPTAISRMHIATVT